MSRTRRAEGVRPTSPDGRAPRIMLEIGHHEQINPVWTGRASMRSASVACLAMAGLLAIAPAAGAADDDDQIPLQILQNWTHNNNTAWSFLNRGDYARAEYWFRMAIDDIRPYVKKDMRLMARSYADLARSVLPPGQVYRRRAAGPLGALSPRVASEGEARRRVPKSLYPGADRGRAGQVQPGRAAPAAGAGAAGTGDRPRPRADRRDDRRAGRRLRRAAEVPGG